MLWRDEEISRFVSGRPMFNFTSARIDWMIGAEHAGESPFGGSPGIHGGQFGLRFGAIREPGAFAPRATDGTPRRAQRGRVNGVGC
jgi:hypothetical protein